MEAQLRVTIYCDRTTSNERYVSVESVGNQNVPTIWVFLALSWIMQFLFMYGTTGIGFNKSIQQNIINISNRKNAFQQFLNMRYYHRSSVLGIRFIAGIALAVSILGSIGIIITHLKLNINHGCALILTALNLTLQLAIIWGLKKTVMGLRKGALKKGWAVAETEMLLATNSKHYMAWIIAAVFLHFILILKCCLA